MSAKKVATILAAGIGLAASLASVAAYFGIGSFEDVARALDDVLRDVSPTERMLLGAPPPPTVQLRFGFGDEGCPFPDARDHEAPAWVCRPSASGYPSATAVQVRAAAAGDAEEAAVGAYVDAIAELARAAHTTLRNEFTEGPDRMENRLETVSVAALTDDLRITATLTAIQEDVAGDLAERLLMANVLERISESEGFRVESTESLAGNPVGEERSSRSIRVRAAGETRAVIGELHGAGFHVVDSARCPAGTVWFHVAATDLAMARLGEPVPQ